MLTAGKIHRLVDARLKGEATILLTYRVIAEVRGRKIFVTDWKGQLVPVTRTGLRWYSLLTDREKFDLLAAARWTPQRADREVDEATFTTAMPIPPMSAFRSRSPTSPIALFARWVDVQAGEWIHPGDVIVHHDDLAALRNEVRDWLAACRGVRGERLSRVVNLHDFAGAPRDGGRSNSVAPGWMLLRSTAKRRGAQP